MIGGEMADPVTVPAEDDEADCSYCGAQGLVVPAAMRLHVPTPLGEVVVALCPRHLTAMVDELGAAEARVTGVKRARRPKLELVRR